MAYKFVLAAALATVATPALAQAPAAYEFTGARVGVELGLLDDDFLGTDEATYGFLAGYDFDAGNVIVGGVVSYTGLFDDDFGDDVRDLTASARVGAKLTPRTLAYGSVGYSNLDADGVKSIDGVKFGLGLEQSFGNLYANVETRYGNYEAGVELYQTVVGVGLRF